VDYFKVQAIMPNAQIVNKNIIAVSLEYVRFAMELEFFQNHVFLLLISLQLGLSFDDN